MKSLPVKKNFPSFESLAHYTSRPKIFKPLIKRRARCIMPASLSDPNATVRVKGVIAVGKIFRKIIQRIVESTIARAIYDWLKHLFEDSDD